MLLLCVTSCAPTHRSDYPTEEEMIIHKQIETIREFDKKTTTKTQLKKIHNFTCLSIRDSH